MSNKDTKESRIKTLKQTQKQRQEDARNRVYKAIERLQNLNAKINFHTISREAQVSVSYLYKYPEIKQQIAELRSKQNSLPVKPVAKPNSTSHGKVVTRLQERIKKLEAENKELKRKCESLAGQVYRAHHVQAQVERLQEQNENLRAKLGKKEIEKKVTPIDKKRQNKSTTLNQIQLELKTLGIELNPTLKKTIKAANEETVLAAIEALKDQLTRRDILNPVGYLHDAIEGGWTKAKSISQSTKTIPKPQIVTASDKPSKKPMSPDKLKQLSNLFNNKDD